MPAWAGGWDHVFGQPHALTNEAGSTARGVARLMSAQGNLAFGAVAAALTGAAPGAQATAQYAQVSARQADGANMGGLVPITPRVEVNRPTTAADELLVDAQLKPTFWPTTYPVDKSGNSGGGFLGTVNK